MATVRDSLLAGHLETVWTQVTPWLPGFTVEALPEIDSSNAELMRRARAGHTDACLLVAEHQTAGRGRMGKRWVGEPGDALTFSLGLPLAPRDWSGLSLAVGLVLAQALHSRVRLKWPNDLWLDGRKLGGILVETATLPTPDERRWLVVGVGLNLRLPTELPAPPDDGAPAPVPPAAVAEWWPQARVGQVLEAVAAPLVQALLRFEREGFAPLVDAFSERDALCGLRVNISNGQTGVAKGVDASGALRVSTETGPLVLTHHEVSVRPC